MKGKCYTIGINYVYIWETEDTLKMYTETYTETYKNIKIMSAFKLY